MEPIKKLKASLQLAEMRLKAESSESNLAIYELAKSAYDNALSSVSTALEPEKILTGKESQAGTKLIEELKEQGKLFNQSEGIAKALDLLKELKVEKFKQVSGESQNSDIPEDTDKNSDTSGTSQPTEPAENAAEPVAQEKPVDPIAENVEPISESAPEEKKTAESQEPQS